MSNTATVLLSCRSVVLSYNITRYEYCYCNVLVLSWLQIGAFFLINLCLVVIATQFSETKKREMSRMLAERKRFETSSSSTLASSSEPSGCYDELIKYVSHIARKVRRRLQRLARRAAQNHRRRRVTPERAAVAVSLRRRHRRRHADRTRRRAESGHQSDSVAVTAQVASSRRSLRSPPCHRADNERPVLKSLPEPGLSQRPVPQVLSQQSPEHHRQPTPQQQQQQQQQQQPQARRPDFLRMPSHDSVGYASIVSVLSWSSLPTPSVNLSSAPLRKASVANDNCLQDSQDSDSITTTRYLVLPLELISVSPQSRRASSASAYMQDFCYLSSERLVLEHCPTVGAVARVRGSVLRSESLGASEPHHPAAATVASSRHRFANRASSFAGEMAPPSPLTHPVNNISQAQQVRDEVARPDAQPTVSDSTSSSLANPVPDSWLPPSSVRPNSVTRASSLSSATTTPRIKSNFLAVPAPLIGAGLRRASIIKARSLGDEEASDTGLDSSRPRTTHTSAPGVNHINRPPVTAARPPDYAASISPNPPVTVCDSADALLTSLPDKSTSGGMNVLSRTRNGGVKVTAAQRVFVGRASSFTTADLAERTQRSTKSSTLIHQTSSVLPQSLKMSSADCVYQRSPSVIPVTPRGLRYSYSSTPVCRTSPSISSFRHIHSAVRNRKTIKLLPAT